MLEDVDNDGVSFAPALSASPTAGAQPHLFDKSSNTSHIIDSKDLSLSNTRDIDLEASIFG
jgi:hypothetical protein